MILSAIGLHTCISGALFRPKVLTSNQAVTNIGQQKESCLPELPKNVQLEEVKDENEKASSLLYGDVTELSTVEDFAVSQHIKESKQHISCSGKQLNCHSIQKTLLSFWDIRLLRES